MVIPSVTAQAAPTDSGAAGLSSSPRVDQPPPTNRPTVPVPSQPVPNGPTICSASNGTWQQVSTISSVASSGFSAGQTLLLTNGMVMVQQSGTGKWFGLHPDSHGCYQDGTWTKLASMPSGYGPTYDGSAVLPNGDVIVEGGEYNVGQSGQVETALGALYNPTKNTWTSVAPPSGVTKLGDVASTVLPNGTFMMASLGANAYQLNLSTLTWTAVPANDEYMNEEGWSLLPNGKVFTVDTVSNGGGVNGQNHNQGSLYDPSKNAWTSAGYAPVPLGDNCPIPQRRSGTAPGIKNVLSLTECPQGDWLDQNYYAAGLKIPFLFYVTNYGTTTVNDVAVKSARTAPSCPETSLSPGQSEICTGHYTTTAADLTNDGCSGGTSCVVDQSDASGTLASDGQTVESPNANFTIDVNTNPICDNGCLSVSEIGPQTVLPNGTVFATGSSGYNALYNVSTGTWSTSSAMDFPEINAVLPPNPCGNTSPYTLQEAEAIDSPAAVLPDGHALVVGGSGAHCPIEFFDFNGTSLNLLPASSQPPDGPTDTNDVGRFFLDLPTGQILDNDGSSSTNMEIYTDTNPPNASWEPTITSVAGGESPSGTYTLSGTQLNGLSEGGSYGDDMQDSTNYPLVKLTNTASGTVTYARTFDMSNSGIAPGQSSSVKFTLPSTTPLGPSSLQVIANGIASSADNVSVYGQQTIPSAATSGAPAAAVIANNSSGGSPCGQAQCYVVAWEGASGSSLWWDTAPAVELQNSYSWSGQKQIPSVATSAPPALGILGGDLHGNLYMAWKGESDNTMWYSTLSGTTWSAEASVPDAATSTTPALAGTTLSCPSGGPSGPVLFLAWKGEGTDTRVFYGYTQNGTSWTIVGQVPGAATDSAPSLTVADGSGLVLAYKVAGATTIDYTLLPFCSGTTGWTTPEQYGGGSLTSTGPAITTDAAGTQSYAAWKGASDDDVYTNQFAIFGVTTNQKAVLNVRTSGSPALTGQPSGANNDDLLVWKGATTGDIWVGPLNLLATG